MENACPSTRCKLFLLLLIAVPFSPINARASTAISTKPPRLAMKLIHSESVFSPYYNPNASILERFWNDINSSMARYSYLNARAKSLLTKDDVLGNVTANYNGTGFYVNLLIGQPPVPQLVAMDTGSSILWIQCLPCTECFEQSSPVFNPYTSSTYSLLNCNSRFCIDDESCPTVGICNYQIHYVQGSSNVTFGREELTFMTSDDGTTSLHNIVFGCSHESRGLESLRGGILGLGSGNVSLVSQIGSKKFSYCIGNIDDPTYEFNQLIIGEGAKLEGYSTPMEVLGDYYYLTLQAISVGEKTLNIDPQIFARNRYGHGGVIIDSGTTVTYLNVGGYRPLEAEVESLIGDLLERASFRNSPRMLCYWGDMRRDLKGFPVVTFHFAGGADLVLDVDAVFRQDTRHTFCMSIVPQLWDSLNVIGIRAQQYYNVGYDLDAMQIYFQMIDCELYES